MEEGGVHEERNDLGLEPAGEIREEEDLDYESYYERLQIPQPNTRNLALRISGVLENLVRVNIDCPSAETLFDMKQPPKIGLRDYIRRIIDYAHNSPESWVLALILVERYVGTKEGVHVHQLNIYK